MQQQELVNIIKSFFKSKCLPINSTINCQMKGIYKLNFSKPNLASEFLEYYNNIIHKSNNKLILKYNKYNIINKNIIKTIPNNKNILPSLKKSIKNASSKKDILLKNDKYIQLYKVMKKNYKSDIISEKFIDSGINKYHQSYVHTIIPKKTKTHIKRNDYINDKYINEETYEGIYSFPFMSKEEKYIREKLLDKKNWLNKNGFLVSVGKYKIKDNFIPNYVNATPSESPLIHQFRDVNKYKWINKRGFIL